MKKILMMSCLICLLSGSVVQAATVTADTRAVEVIKRYEARIKELTTKRARDLQSVASSATQKIKALTTERDRKLAGTKDALQIKAINKEYADKIAKIKAGQGVESKKVSDNNQKEKNTLQADLNAVKTQIKVEKAARDRDAAKIKQERAKKATKTLSTAELKKADEAKAAEIKKKLAESKAKREAEQAAWSRRHPAGSVILENK